MIYINEDSFKPIKENPIILDFTGYQYLGEVHLLLKQKFGLPEYYGENWDAFWDCMDGLFRNRGTFSVEVHGFYSMKDGLEKYCMPMLRIFEDVHKKTPNFNYTLIS